MNSLTHNRKQLAEAKSENFENLFKCIELGMRLRLKYEPALTLNHVPLVHDPMWNRAFPTRYYNYIFARERCVIQHTWSAKGTVKKFGAYRA